MQKDLKIGLVLGLVLVLSALIWLATRPSLSPIARMPNIPASELSQETSDSVNNPLAKKVDANENQSPEIRPQTESSNSAQYEQAEKIKPQKFHIVRKNETLSIISNKYYGSAGRWQKIYDYNRNKIKDPNKLIPGTKLIIPD